MITVPNVPKGYQVIFPNERAEAMKRRNFQGLTSVFPLRPTGISGRLAGDDRFTAINRINGVGIERSVLHHKSRKTKLITF